MDILTNIRKPGFVQYYQEVTVGDHAVNNVSNTKIQQEISRGKYSKITDPYIRSIRITENCPNGKHSSLKTSVFLKEEK